MKTGEPSYIALFRSGELEERVNRLERRLEACDICPQECGIDRTRGQTGACRTGLMPVVSSFCAHHGEEPVISGQHGSGTIFFGNCNMSCIYCQNHQISTVGDSHKEDEATTAMLAGKMLYLQDELGCHNINLVTPSHVVPQIVRAVYEAVPRGLKIPLVYNTSGYDSAGTLKELDGIVDIYLADLRYASDEMAEKYSQVGNYTERARAAIKEMHRQVRDLVLDEDGVAVRGLIIRHLILPGGIAGSRESLTWLVNEVSPDITVSIMAQYYPAHRAEEYPEINRRITPEEFDEVVGIVEEVNLQNGWMQEMESAEYYRPDFTEEKPFSGEGPGERP